MGKPKDVLFLSPSGFAVVQAPDESGNLALHLFFSEREKLLLKLPDNLDLSLLLSPDEAARLAGKLLEKAALGKA